MAFSYTAFSACVANDWQISIADPNVAGWAICATYALAACLATIVWRTSPFAAAHQRRERILWTLITCLMAALALNKELDLQTLILTAGRCLSQAQGWYADRRLVQRDFILALIALACAAGAGIIWLLRGIMHHNLIALSGLVALAGFVLFRGGSMFHIFEPEQAFEGTLLHNITSALEVLSPVLIILAAWRLLRQPRLQPSL